MDRTYQPLFLRSLKTYFESKRLIKQGDLIAISLDTDDVGLAGDSHASDDTLDADGIVFPNQK